MAVAGIFLAQNEADHHIAYCVSHSICGWRSVPVPSLTLTCQYQFLPNSI